MPKISQTLLAIFCSYLHKKGNFEVFFSLDLTIDFKLISFWKIKISIMTSFFFTKSMKSVHQRSNFELFPIKTSNVLAIFASKNVVLFRFFFFCIFIENSCKILLIFVKKYLKHCQLFASIKKAIFYLRSNRSFYRFQAYLFWKIKISIMGNFFHTLETK